MVPKVSSPADNETTSMRGARFLIELDYKMVDDMLLQQRPGTKYATKDKTSDILNNVWPSAKFSWMQKHNDEKRPFPSYIINAICRKLAWFNNWNDNSTRIISITGCTEIHIGTKQSKAITSRHIVCAHPDYRGEGMWMDWVDVTWENINNPDEPLILPAQVIMFLNFEDSTYEQMPLHVSNILFPLQNINIVLGEIGHCVKQGIHVLIHSAEDDGITDDDITMSSVSISKRFKMEPYYQLISLEYINDICFVARDPPSLHQNDKDEMMYEVSYVMHPTDWYLPFIPKLHEGYVVPAEDEAHLDEFNEEFNPW
jgi:hypothetical protein